MELKSLQILVATATSATRPIFMVAARDRRARTVDMSTDLKAFYTDKAEAIRRLTRWCDKFPDQVGNVYALKTIYSAIGAHSVIPGKRKRGRPPINDPNASPELIAARAAWAQAQREYQAARKGIKAPKPVSAVPLTQSILERRAANAQRVRECRARKKARMLEAAE